jgi:hypothetical protein
VELCLHSPNAPSWRGAQLGGHGGNFTFYYYIVKNRDWAVGTATTVRAERPGFHSLQVPRFFSPRHRVQTGSAAPAMGSGGN